jgi:D-glycero-beta-D-manno-heptose-7-phosphate kinase
MTVQREKSKILLIGDNCIDRYVFVEKTRHNPENDSPLLTEIHTLEYGGMAANVHRCLRNLLLDVTSILPGKQSIKTRYIDIVSGDSYFRVDHDIPAEPIKIETIPLSQYDCIVVSDYNKGYITDDTLEYIQCYFSGPKFLDTKKTNLSNFHKFFIKINEAEAIAARNNVPNHAVVTLGAFGALAYSYDREDRIPALNVECVDVCGAGDAFLAGYVYGFLKTEKMNDAIVHGIVNSGISVTKRGTYAPTLEELEKGLTKYAEQRW